MKLPKYKLVSILENHSMFWHTRNGRIMGHTAFTQAYGEDVAYGIEYTDLTDFNMPQLYVWLGY